MGWTHGTYMVRMKDEILPKRYGTKKQEGCMGGLSKEISEKGREGRKVERKGQQQRAMEKNNKTSHTAE